MELFDFKRISDPVHGSMGFSECEVDVINTRAFQRLRNVRQLGLVQSVFPGADFSRFSHSLGVCHLTCRILQAIRDGSTISTDQMELYRLAGLLHDVGHYPFSHPMEQAIQNYYNVETFTTKEGDDVDSSMGEAKAPFRHERLGKEVLLSDEQIQRTLKKHSIDPLDISRIFLREGELVLANLVASDLDADRIDYLLRTAHYTGLPYGHVDLEYLLSQLTVDQSNYLCLSPKALRTADHFLLSRYFQYQQVILHKNVVSFELVLKDIFEALFKKEIIDCSRKAMTERIRAANWNEFDDAYVIQRIRELAKKGDIDSSLRAKTQVILERKPPLLVAQAEFLGPRQERDEFNQLEHFNLNCSRMIQTNPECLCG